MQPQEDPARVLLGLHGNSTERFFLQNLYCLEFKPTDQMSPSIFRSFEAEIPVAIFSF